MTDPTPMTVPPQGHLVLELPHGVAPAAVVQALLVVRAGNGLAIVGGEMEGMVPVERRRLADLLDAAADELVRRADELEGGICGGVAGFCVLPSGHDGECS